MTLHGALPVAKSGRHVSLRVPGANHAVSGSPIWSFTAGYKPGVNLLYLTARHPALSTWGVALFYAKTVTYDLKRGIIVISRQTSPA
jgi:hypothetical protein